MTILQCSVSGTGNGVPVTDVFLAAGDYAIEATAATAGATSGYRLTVTGDRAPGQPARTAARVVERISRTWAHQPATATAAAQSVTPSGFDAQVSTADDFASLTVDPADAACTATIAADAGCVSAQRRPASVTIDLGSASTNASTLDTYLLLLAGHDSTGTVIDSDDDGGNAPRASRITADLAAGDYTIEATTYRSNKTGDYTLTVDTAANTQGCTTRLGTLAAGQYIHNGNITADENCASQQRTTSTTRRHYANWYTLTLDAPAWMDIDLEKPAASSLDPYLILTRGTPTDGTVLHQDDNTGTGLSSQLSSIHLPPGNYTIEATSHNPADTGTHKLTLTIPIHGLPQQINTTIDQQTTIGFTYWPTNARTSIDSSARSMDAVAESLGLGMSFRGGTGTFLMSPVLAETHGFGVAYSAQQSDSTGRATRSAGRSAGSGAAVRQFGFDVNAVCGAGLVASDRNGVLCVSASAQSGTGSTPEDGITAADRGRKYPMTRGTLIGLRAVTEDVLAGRACTLTPNRLAALMLSIPLWEVPRSIWIDSNGDGMPQDIEYRAQRDPARSPMALSRKDRRPREAASYSAVAPRAFWHPGVSGWQLDDINSRYVGLNHAQRAEITEGGRRVAEYLAGRLCSVEEVDLERVLTSTNLEENPLQPWLACRPGASNTCYSLSYRRLWVNGPDDLHVTVHTSEYQDGDPHDPGFDQTYDYRGAHSISGGLSEFDCRWGSAGVPFDCWFYDTDNPEGWMVADELSGSTKQSPLAAPFMSFTDNPDGTDMRFVVFPSSFLGGRPTQIKAVPLDMDVQDSATDHPWSSLRYSGEVLRMQVCRASGVPPLVTSRCAWVSANSTGPAGLAQQLRIAGLWSPRS